MSAPVRLAALLTLAPLASFPSPRPAAQGSGAVPAADPAPAPGEAGAGALLLTGARILAPAGDGWLEGHVLRIEGGRIAGVLPAGDVRLDPGVPALDLAGAYLVPGLIDLHTHLLLHPYDEASWNEQVLEEPLGLRTARAVAAARETLAAGFTTIRELGTEGAGYTDVGLREAIAGGVVPGPRILASTRALVTTGGYGPAGFDPRWEMPKGAQVADGPSGVRVATREQIAAGADWIKVYADYRRRGDASTPTFSPEELAAIVDEATSAGLPVAAHATTEAGIRRAVEAGVRTIEHGTEASAETLARMRERGVVLCPTLAAGEAIARYTGYEPGAGGPEPERVRAGRELVRRALDAGVTIACGSDAGVFAHGDNARELELLVEWGASPAQALAAATSVAAAALGKDGELGRIAPGFVADLAAFTADPLASPTALRDPVLIVANGRVAVNRLAAARPDEEAAVLALCREMLAAYSARRFGEVDAMFAPGAVVSYDLAAGDRQEVLPATEFLEHARAGLARVEVFAEWIAAEPTVLLDGKIAVVWAPFLVDADGRGATGIDVFQLVKLDGAWRFASLAFTNRSL